MIWHIFRKDWKLLWPMVVGTALITAIARMLVMFTGGIFARFRLLIAVANLLEALSFVAVGVVIVMVVQHDALAGLRQDWLVRPIGRRDLLLSKIVFVVLAVQAPIFVFEFAQCLGSGFSPGESFTATISHSLWMLLALDLPVLAFATLTRNLAEALGAGIAAALGVAIFTSLHQIRSGAVIVNGPGVDWVTDSALVIWALAAAAIILALQYSRRRTNLSRWTFGSATVLWVIVGMLPWQTAFAVQERLSPQPSAANPVQIAFAPGLGKFKRRPGVYQGQHYINGEPGAEVTVFVPLVVNGLQSDQSLAIERLTARVTKPDGKIVDISPAQRTGLLADWQAHHQMWIPESLYKSVRDQPVRMEVDYSLTLLRANPVQRMPALDGIRRVPEQGLCATRTNSGETQIEVHCITPGQEPCAIAFLENPQTGKRTNAQIPGCALNYSPYFERVEGDSMSRFNRTFPFRDPSGQIEYPVDGSQLKDAQVAIEVYQPLAHFTRQVVIPDIRLGDWTEE